MIGNPDGPSPNSALPPRILINDASPKAALERTSYLQFVWNFSATHKSIRANVPWFGPPVSRHLQPAHGQVTWFSGLADMILRRPIQTRFPAAPSLFNLTSHHIVTRRFILAGARLTH